ncbi:7872_t:CDS:1, partial [Funneliformis geosporum]
VSHRILHIVTNDYCCTTIMFASTYVAEKVAEHFERQQKRELITFLSVSEGDGRLGSLRGQLFEGYAHNVLRKGGIFRIRKLGGNQEELILKPRDEQLFVRLEDVDVTLDNYFRPVSKNFASIDSLIPDVGLFQMTISPRHNIKTTTLKKWRDITGENKCLLYFVIPGLDLFQNYSVQRFIINNETQALDFVEQYVLEIVLKS